MKRPTTGQMQRIVDYGVLNSHWDLNISHHPNKKGGQKDSKSKEK